MSNIPTLHLPPALLSCSTSSIYLRLIKEHIGDINEYYICLHTLHMYSRCRFEQSKTTNSLHDILVDNALFDQLKRVLSLPSENQFIGSGLPPTPNSGLDIYTAIKNRIADDGRYKEFLEVHRRYLQLQNQEIRLRERMARFIGDDEGLWEEFRAFFQNPVKRLRAYEHYA
ncbi:hypothetical protein FPQ18DRAFT_384036 [Pyronema domesticum]|uniref:Uncharacterized protein n=1 Tax=Pyronema omphalodes (strain CBS 100304) TaxID=1076935 RepID=U4LIN6_PYROM|nr:hypothetical protein FPQ18DRAFT_384036 [Pyronema domesticum]CCX31392.1 Protein of unknown function [Pyronema omphalodes CBS 100304]